MPDAFETSSSGVLNPGDKLGPFTIAAQIGAGGSSVVFRAYDPLLGRTVAIKQMLLRGSSDDDAKLRERVKAEAAAQRQVAEAEPTHLVRLLDVIETPSSLFLVSEFVDGPSLEQILTLNPRPMDLKQAMGIMAAVARALSAIHRHGMLHRDLKPANILLPRTGGLKVADFGLATAMADQQVMSQGSVRYMAPELLRGEPADGRADLYALGIIAYEMIAGRTAFDEAFRMVLRDQRNQAMRWVKWHTNPRAQAPALGELRSELPAVVGELVARLMEKEPARRVPAAQDLIEAIRRHFASPPAPGTILASVSTDKLPAQVVTTLRATTTPGDTAPLPPRNRLPLVLAGLLAVWLVLGGGLGLYFYQGHRAEQAAAIHAAEAVMDEARTAYRAGLYSDALTAYQQVADAWPTDTPLGQRAQAGVLLSRGQIDLAAGDYDAARAAFVAVDEMGVLGDRDPVRGLIEEAEHRSAFAAAMAGIEKDIRGQRFAEARQNLREWRSLTLTEEEEQRLREIAAQLEDQLAQLDRDRVLAEAQKFLEAGQRDQAMGALAAALASVPNARLQARYDELVTARRVDAAVARARDAERENDLRDAIRAYEEAYQIRADAEIGQKLDALQSRGALAEGLRLLQQGDTAGASAALTRSLRYQENEQARSALEGLADVSRKTAFVSDGDRAAALGDFDAAVNQYRNALALGADAAVEQKLQQVQVRLLLQQSAEALRTGQLNDAQKLLTQASQQFPQNAEVAAALTELAVHQAYRRHLDAGDAARDRSNFGAAKGHYRDALGVLDTSEAHQRLEETEYDHLIALARSYIAMEEYAAARSLLRTAQGSRPSPQVEHLLAEIAARLAERERE